MKKYIYLISYFFILLSCKSNKLDSTKIMFFNGMINSRFPVILWMTKKNDVIIGEVVYLKGSKKTIKLIGVYQNDEIYLDEFLNDGSISGIWKGKIKRNSLNGIWHSVDGEREYKFDLKISNTKLMDTDTNIIPMDYTGHYAYKYGSDGYHGSIIINKNGDHYTLTCSNVTSAPARNMADFYIDTLKIINNESIIDLNGDGLCVFRIKYYKDFVIIKTIDEKRECGFGHNAYVDGTYIKIKKN